MLSEEDRKELKELNAKVIRDSVQEASKAFGKTIEVYKESHEQALGYVKESVGRVEDALTSQTKYCRDTVKSLTCKIGDAQNDAVIAVTKAESAESSAEAAEKKATAWGWRIFLLVITLGVAEVLRRIFWPSQ